MKSLACIFSVSQSTFLLVFRKITACVMVSVSYKSQRVSSFHSCAGQRSSGNTSWHSSVHNRNLKQGTELQYKSIKPALAHNYIQYKLETKTSFCINCCTKSSDTGHWTLRKRSTLVLFDLVHSFSSSCIYSTSIIAETKAQPWFPQF